MPNSAVLTTDIADRELNTGQDTGVESSFRLDPALPLVHLALAAFEKDAIQADFLRHYELRHLPTDATTRLLAVAMLRHQNQPQLALGVANANPESADALRQIIVILQDDSNRPAEALPFCEQLVALPDATASDISNAGLLCIEQKLVPRGRALLQQAITKFPDDPKVYQLQGWALIGLALPAEALAAFQRSETLIKKAGLARAPGLLAGLTASQWLTGDKTGAVETYQRLIPARANYADKKWVAALHWTDAEKTPLLAALVETLRLHPELAPKPDAHP